MLTCLWHTRPCSKCLAHLGAPEQFHTGVARTQKHPRARPAFIAVEKERTVEEHLLCSGKHAHALGPPTPILQVSMPGCLEAPGLLPWHKLLTAEPGQNLRLSTLRASLKAIRVWSARWGGE